MELRDFGATGLSVTPLGFGAMQLGDPAMDDRAAGRLLNQVLDLGVGLIDTARSYGLSEERIGRHLSRRRDEFVLSTKLGYGVDGCEDWTWDCVCRGVDRALSVLRTDRIDVAHLHSCPAAVLLSNGVLDALAAVREQGKLRYAAYSGDNEALGVAARSGLVQSVQASVSLFDQANLRRHLPAVTEAGLGVLGKRTLGGAPWRAGRELAPPEAEYRRRFELMENGLPPVSEMPDCAIRFAAFAPGVTCVLVGGTQIEHLRDNVAAVERGPLPAATLAQIEAAWRHFGADWDSIV